MSLTRNPRPAKPRHKRRTIAAAVPASQWPAWTDAPFDAAVGAIYIAELSAPSPAPRRRKGGRR